MNLQHVFMKNNFLKGFFWHFLIPPSFVPTFSLKVKWYFIYYTIFKEEMNSKLRLVIHQLQMLDILMWTSHLYFSIRRARRFFVVFFLHAYEHVIYLIFLNQPYNHFLLISVLTNKANKEEVDVAVILVPLLFSLLLLAVFILCHIYKIRIKATWKQAMLQVTIDIWFCQLYL